MRCSVCGADNLEGAAYCEDCGARLAAAAAPVTQENTVPATPVAQPAPSVAPYVSPTPSPAPAVSAPGPAPSAGGPSTCAACGAQNPPGVSFCEDCGASLSEQGNGPSAPVHPVSYDSHAPAVAPATPPGRTGARLILTNGKELFLDKDTILVGRRSPVDGIFPEVDLTDFDTEAYISRRHGRFTRQDSGLVYEDLGSSNGSFHNGTRLQGGVQTVLHDGDSLKLGKTEMVVRMF
jgi:hypothetical protein